MSGNPDTLNGDRALAMKKEKEKHNCALEMKQEINAPNRQSAPSSLHICLHFITELQE